MAHSPLSIPQTHRQSLSPNPECNHRTRVINAKYLNEANQALQSLITAGRLKRMELISINNRALFNKGKVQRCEWLMKRRHSIADSGFLPDIKNISLDARTPKNIDRQKNQTKTEKRIKHSIENEEFLNTLVEEEIKRIKDEDLLGMGMNQQDLVKQACQAISKKIMKKAVENEHKEGKGAILTQSVDISNLAHHDKYRKDRKEHKRSVTEAVYFEEIKELEKRQDAFMKSKEEERKCFLRKFKTFRRK